MPTTTTARATDPRSASEPQGQPSGAPSRGAPLCPKCNGRMWDNRIGKRNRRAPDFKCRDTSCDGALWPGQHTAPPASPLTPNAGHGAPPASPVPGMVDESHARRATARRAMLRRCYLDTTSFVLDEVRSKYGAAGIACSDSALAAIVATLFIQTCARGYDVALDDSTPDEPDGREAI